MWPALSDFFKLSKLENKVQQRLKINELDLLCSPNECYSFSGEGLCREICNILVLYLDSN